MFERKISVKSVKEILETGRIIEDYSADMPEPARLIMGYQGNRPVHLVLSENTKGNQVIVVTVYIPDQDKWKKDHRSRIR
jgi:Domain of unknown function (DUF4258)